jgi:hypothetical protein
MLCFISFIRVRVGTVYGVPACVVGGWVYIMIGVIIIYGTRKRRKSNSHASPTDHNPSGSKKH